MSRPEVAFEATAPFAFFDYFRVPYRVAPTNRPRAAPPVRGAEGLWPVHDPGVALFWCRADERARRECVAGQLAVDGIPFAARVVRDDALEPELDRDAWQRLHTITDAAGAPVSAIWRHRDGRVLLPFDPGAVMTLL